jgi:hypothetical protein
MSQVKSHLVLIIFVGLGLLAGCVSSDYKAVKNLAELKVSFVDSSWDGNKIPEGQHCKKFGGDGSTPSLKIENIPSESNAVIVEFSDRSFFLMNHGGHGSIGMWLESQQTAVVMPSVAGETTIVPDKVFIEKQHRGTRGKDGAYLPPCSGGRGNHYYAEVKAVFKDEINKKESKLLGSGEVYLGEY